MGLAGEGHMGAGSVKRNLRTGTWYGRCDARRDAGGARRQIRVHAATEGDCWRRLRAKMAEIENGYLTSRDRERMTVSELLDLWLDTKKGKEFRTIDSYQAVTRLHLKPALGHLRVRDVRRSDIERAIVKWQTGPRLDGKPGRRGNTTVRQCITYINGAFNLAKDDGLRSDNPVDGVGRPRRTKPKKAFVLAPGAKAILSAAHGTAYYVALFIAFVGGLRPGELLSLCRHDIDLIGGYVHVTTALEYRGKHLKRKTPKSEAGKRDIPVAELVVTILETHMDEQVNRLRDLGVTAGPHTPLFDDGLGAIWHPEAFGKGFRRLLKGFGLPRIPWKATRHSFASIGITEAVHTKVLAEILGHEDEKITSTVYEHVDDTAKREANRRISSALLESSAAP
jgi:integrase